MNDEVRPVSIEKATRDNVNSKPESEAGRLDVALDRADELLVESLRHDDQRRNRQKIVLLTLGGIAMLTAVCFTLLSMTNASSNAETLSAEGWKLWQQQEFEAAIEKFEAAVEADPKLANAWNGLGWARFNSGDRDQGKEAFAEAVKLVPNHPAALNGLGQTSFFDRDYLEAEKHLLKAAPQASAAWWGLAKLYLLTGEFDKAKTWARKIVDSGSTDEGAERLLAAAEAGELSDDLRKVIEPAAPASGANAEHGKQVARGWQLMNQGKQSEAESAFQAVLDQDDENTAALNGMGWLLMGKGAANEAKPYFEQVLKLEPLASGAMNGLARVLKAEGDTEGAIALWQKMVDEVPGPHAGTFGLANAYMEDAKYAKALPLLEELVKANPNDARLKNQLNRARKQAQN